MFHRILVACLGLALFACAAPAFAAEAVSPGWGDILKPWWDMFTQGLIAAVVALAAAGARRWFGIDLEERHRRALHQALTTGAEAAWAKVAGLMSRGMSDAEARQTLVAETIAHARIGAPDAIAAFGLTEGDPRLINLALSKLKQTLPAGAEFLPAAAQPAPAA
jgi:type IV secretory pathway VirB2 component (pilin)